MSCKLIINENNVDSRNIDCLTSGLIIIMLLTRSNLWISADNIVNSSAVIYLFHVIALREYNTALKSG